MGTAVKPTPLDVPQIRDVASDSPGGLRRNVQRLVAGNGAAQALQFAALLLLSRMYLPADFGTLARVQAIGSIGAILVSLQLHLSIPLCKSSHQVTERIEAVESLALTWVLVLPLLALAGFWESGVGTALAIVLAVGNTQASVLVYRGSFGALSGFFVARAILAVSLQLVCGALGVRGGLLIGAIAGELLSATLLRRVATGAHLPRIRSRETLATIRDQIAFSLYGTVQELVSVASFYAPLLLFASSFGAGTGGQYAMANRLVFAPVVLLSSSLAQVLYHRLGQAAPATLRDVWALYPSAWLLLPFAVLCALPFWLTSVFQLIIGREWQVASEMIPHQVLWGAVFLMSIPARVVCRVRLQQRAQLVVDAATLALIGLAFVVAPTTPMLTMWRLVAIAVVQNVSLALIVFRSLRRAEVRR